MMDYELIYKVRKAVIKTDSLSNLQVQYRNKAEAEAQKEHKKYLDLLEKLLKTDKFEVTNVACMADGIIGHVYVGNEPKGSGKRKCCFCQCDDFDSY